MAGGTNRFLYSKYCKMIFVYLAIYGYLYPQSKFIVKYSVEFLENLCIMKSVYCKMCYLYIGNYISFREMLSIRHKP